jgi:hypothetical protein
MNDFFTDLVQDLRQKRLLPVAIGLILVIVATPIVLAKSPEAPPATPTETASASAAPKGNPLKLDVSDAESSAKGSALNVLSERNPFKPPRSVTATKAEASSATAGASDPAGSGGGGGQPADPGNSGGNGGTDTPGVPNPAPLQTKSYEYVADVTFWNGDRRHERRLHKLDMLPNQETPILIFMGVTGDGGDAVFLVDSSLDTTGEGNCRPSNSNCTFVNIGAGAEHLFTTVEGDTYRLRVDEIRRVKLRASAAGDEHNVTGSAVANKPFNLPRLVDTVEETAAVESHSSPAASGR